MYFEVVIRRCCERSSVSAVSIVQRPLVRGMQCLAIYYSRKS